MNLNKINGMNVNPETEVKDKVKVLKDLMEAVIENPETEFFLVLDKTISEKCTLPSSIATMGQDFTETLAGFIATETMINVFNILKKAPTPNVAHTRAMAAMLMDAEFGERSINERKIWLDERLASGGVDQPTHKKLIGILDTVLQKMKNNTE